MSKHANTNANNDATDALVQQSLSRWQRLRQFQPTLSLVKYCLFWWLSLLFVSLVVSLDDLAYLTQIAKALHWLSLLVFVLLVAISIIDLLVLARISRPELYKFQRNFPRNVAIFNPVTIDIVVDFVAVQLSTSYRKLFAILRRDSICLQFYDDYPDHVRPCDKDMPYDVQIPLTVDSKDLINKDIISKKISYPVMPLQRGTGYFGQAFFKVYSPLGLFQRKFALSETMSHDDKLSLVHKQANSITSSGTKHALSSTKYLRVLSDFSKILTNELSAVFDKSAQLGIQNIKEQGQGSEFLNLREYAVGDAMRQIDWKASARHRRMMSKSYEIENDQDVIFLLDCGEQMRHKDANDSSVSLANSNEQHSSKTHSHKALNYFDKVLNALLLLAYVANKQGDKVGLMTFGNLNEADDKFVTPAKGASLIRNLLNETADLTPTLSTSDYYQAVMKLKKSVKRRSLVIVVTNTRQEATEELLKAMSLLSKQYQVVFANLTEQSIQDVLDLQEMPVDMDDALYYHALVSYQQSRKKLHKKLTQSSGIFCIEATAERLPKLLTDAYHKMVN